MKTQYIRALVEDYYDIQDVRLRSESRARAYEQGVSEQDMAVLKEMTGKSLKKLEGQIKTKILKELKNYPIWTEWLVNVKGVGPVLAGGLLTYIEDVNRFATISKLWTYAGLGLRDGKVVKKAKGEKINYNPRFKVLMWKCGESFVKTKGGYRELYEQHRQKYEDKWLTPEICGSVGCKNKGKCLDGHKYAAAKRKVEKIFLAHVFQKWHELEGSTMPTNPYIIGREGHEHLVPIVNS